MKMQTNVGEIEVTLSRRNLLSLLHKLDWENSKRTIQKRGPGGMLLTVVAEDDKEHYGDGEAGTMHDETERFIEKHAETQRQAQEQAESQDALEYVTDLLGSWKPNV